MNISQLPTDNLYKFITIGGLTYIPIGLSVKSPGQYWLVGAGIVFFFGGLLFWYFKTQRIQDKKLKKEAGFEKVFNLRFEALKEISFIYNELQPKKIWKDMDVYDYYESIVMSSSNLHNLITDYIGKNSAILSTSEQKEISDLKWIANDMELEINKKDFSVSNRGIKLGEEFSTNLKELCDNMKKKFDKEYK